MIWIQIEWLQERVSILEKLLERICKINDLKSQCVTCEYLAKSNREKPCCDCDLKNNSKYERVKQEEL